MIDILILTLLFLILMFLYFEKRTYSIIEKLDAQRQHSYFIYSELVRLNKVFRPVPPPPCKNKEDE